MQRNRFDFEIIKLFSAFLTSLNINLAVVPLGNDELEQNFVSFCMTSCPEDTSTTIDDSYTELAPVGQFSDGSSTYGALNLAVNVWEWVYDYYDPLYYEASPYDNPLVPDRGNRYVTRVGGWNNPDNGNRTVAMASMLHGDYLDTIGFRCVIDDETLKR